MIEKTTIPAGHGKAFILNKSQTISVINTYGTQVVDCWAFNLSLIHISEPTRLV